MKRLLRRWRGLGCKRWLAIKHDNGGVTWRIQGHGIVAVNIGNLEHTRAVYDDGFATLVYRAFKFTAAHPDNRCGRVELGMGLGGGTGQLTDFAAFVVEPANPNGGFKSSDIGCFIKLVLI